MSAPKRAIWVSRLGGVACIERSIEKDLPAEIGFLEHRDAFHNGLAHVVDMPERTVDMLLRFLQQGGGTLSKRARTREFAALSDDEVSPRR